MATYVLTPSQLNNRILNSFSIPAASTVPTVSDPDAQAFLDAAIITDITQANAVNSLVIGLKADGLWTNMQVIYPFVGGTASSHKYNLKDPRDLDAAYRLSFSGGWTHNANGITGNGVNTYADTFYNYPNSFGVYSRISTPSVFTGIYEITYIDGEYNGDAATILRGDALVLKNYPFSAGSAPYTKFYSIVDNNSSAPDQLKIYRNGSNVLPTSYGSILPFYKQTNFVLGAVRSLTYNDGNLTTAYNQYGTANLAFSYFSTSILNSTQNTNLNNRVVTFQTALSRQV
jgi:hypothetical protein